jgi:hypothetical protein
MAVVKGELRLRDNGRAGWNRDGTMVLYHQNFLQLTKEGALPCNELGSGTSGMSSDGWQYGVSGSPFFFGLDVVLDFVWCLSVGCGGCQLVV